MASISADRSLRTSLILASVTIAAVALLIAMSLLYLSYRHEASARLIQQAEVLAAITASNAGSNIVANDSIGESQRLHALNRATAVETVQIFRYANSEGQLQPFASYYQAGILPHWIAPAIFNRLNEPRFSEGKLKLARSIVIDGQPLGMLYMQLATDSIDRELGFNLLVLVLALVVSLLIATVLAVWQQQRLGRPLDTLLGLAQAITREQDFSLRIPPLPLQELQLLGLAINRMLDKVERQLLRQAQAEQEIRQLNDSLEQQVSNRTQALSSANLELVNTLEQLHRAQARAAESQANALELRYSQLLLGELERGLRALLQPPLAHLPLQQIYGRWLLAAAISRGKPGNDSPGLQLAALYHQVATVAAHLYPALQLHEQLELQLDAQRSNINDSALALVILHLLEVLESGINGYRLLLSHQDHYLLLQLSSPRPFTASQRQRLGLTSHAAMAAHNRLPQSLLELRVLGQLQGLLHGDEQQITALLPDSIQIAQTPR